MITLTMQMMLRR